MRYNVMKNEQPLVATEDKELALKLFGETLTALLKSESEPPKGSSEKSSVEFFSKEDGSFLRITRELGYRSLKDPNVHLCKSVYTGDAKLDKAHDISIEQE